MFKKLLRVSLGALAIVSALGAASTQQATAQSAEVWQTAFQNESPYYVQSGTGDQYSAGAAGVQRRDTDRTAGQAWQDFTPDKNAGIAATALPGQTFSTGPGSLTAGDVMGAALPRTRVGRLAVNSTLDLPIPSGDFDLGFPDNPRDPQRTNRDPGSSYRDREFLPRASTASVAFDIVEHFEPSNDPDPALSLGFSADLGVDASLEVGADVGVTADADVE